MHRIAARGRTDVRYGSKADIATDQLNVRFTPKAEGMSDV